MSEPLLSIDHLTIRYGERAVVRDVSLHIHDGEIVGLIGESGSGKSLTALAALGLVSGHPDIKGQILWKGQDLIGLGESAWRTTRSGQIGIVFQDPMNSLNPLMTLGAQILEAMPTRRGASRRDRLNAAAELLGEVGLRDPERLLRRYPFELSGGQQQRAMIAMVLAAEPSLLIADEPTTALDVTTQAQVLALLRTVQSRRRMAMLFISHDLDVVMSMADRVAVMRYGSLVECGATDAILHRPQHEYTRELVGAHKGRSTRRAARSTAVGEDAIRATGVCVDYGHGRGKSRALHGIDLHLRQGTTLGIAGESGSGKTTLARMLVGLVPPATGSVLVCGMDPVDPRQRTAFARTCQYVFQDATGSLNPRRTILQALAEPLRAVEPAITRDATIRRCEAMLEEVGLDGSLLSRFPHQLSGGQRQRVVIARALAMRPKVLICDEPVSALDATVRNQVLDLLARLRDAHGLTLVFIGHDLAVMQSLTDEVLVLRQGRIVEHGATEAVFGNPRAPYTRELLTAGRLETRADGTRELFAETVASPLLLPGEGTAAVACDRQW